MDLSEERVIGVVGGVGPHAGNALLNAITRNTNASRDQEHHSVVLMSFPKHIEDRTSFLDKTSSVNPAFSIVSIIQKLEMAGSCVVGIACNTAHAPEIYDIILEELVKANSKVRLINMVDETCSHIKQDYSWIKRIGLMTTNGTYRSGLYKDRLVNFGYEIVLPDFKFQDEVIHRLIYDPLIGLKGRPREVSKEALWLTKEALRFFKRSEVDAVVLGCTELSLIKQVCDSFGDFVVVDSLDVMACALIREATIE